MKQITLSKQSLLASVRDYLIITVGLVLYVLGWTVFLIPNNLIGGGASGMSSIIQYATGIKMGYTFFALNVVFLIAAVFTIGISFGAKTVYAIIVTSIGLTFCQGLIPAEIIEMVALNNGKLMCTIMGGIMAGTGIGMSISAGGSTGGTDILAMIINKYRNISPGQAILMMDVVIILSSLLVPSYTAEGATVPFPEKITTVVYGLLLVAINSYVLDLYISGSKQSVQLFIVSEKYAEIADMLSGTMHKGVTVIPGEGWYTKKASHILMVITRKRDLKTVLAAVKAYDPSAFLSVSSVMGVYGRGFDVIRGANKKPESV